MNDITQFLMAHGGAVLFAIVLVEQAGLPLPAAPWLLAAGALSASGQLNPVLAIGVTALACVMADLVWFYVGRRGGQRVLRLFCRLSLARTSCVGRTKVMFARHGLQALAAAKFLPGLGTVMPPLAGALGMRTGRFLLFDGLGSLFYAAFYILVGLVFHAQLEQAIVVLKQLGVSVLLLMLVLGAGYIAFKYARRKRPNGKIGHDPAESREAGVTVNEQEVSADHAHRGATSLAGESLNTADFPNIALAFTSAQSQLVGARAASPLASHPL